MRTTIIAVVSTILVIAMATVLSQAEPEVVEPIESQTAVPEEPVEVEIEFTEEQEETWTEIAFSKVTKDHQLYLTVEEQRLYQACVIKTLKAQYVFDQTGSEKAKTDLDRFNAEVDRWNRQVEESKSE